MFDDTYHPNADKWTTARTLSLSGDASGSVSWDGSANATLSVTVANDSHNHDGRYYTETEANSRFVNVTGDTMTGSLTIDTTGTALTIGGDSSLDGADASIYMGNAPSSYGFYFTYEGTGAGNTNALVISSTNSGSPKELLRSNQDGIVNLVQSNAKVAGNTIFHDTYHPNADKWTTARTLSLTGGASGSTSWDGSGNASISVTVANGSTTWGAVGTYAYAQTTGTVYNITAGSTTRSGSSIRPHAVTVYNTGASYTGNHHWPSPGSAPGSGTWQAMGGMGSAWGGGSKYTTTLWVRIA
jgi:hypothetical protein